jgi:hypothetical protein
MPSPTGNLTGVLRKNTEKRRGADPDIVGSVVVGDTEYAIDGWKHGGEKRAGLPPEPIYYGLRLKIRPPAQGSLLEQPKVAEQNWDPAKYGRNEAAGPDQYNGVDKPF